MKHPKRIALLVCTLVFVALGVLWYAGWHVRSQFDAYIMECVVRLDGVQDLIAADEAEHGAPPQSWDDLADLIDPAELDSIRSIPLANGASPVVHWDALGERDAVLVSSPRFAYRPFPVLGPVQKLLFERGCPRPSVVVRSDGETELRATGGCDVDWLE